MPNLADGFRSNLLPTLLVVEILRWRVPAFDVGDVSASSLFIKDSGSSKGAGAGGSAVNTLGTGDDCADMVKGLGTPEGIAVTDAGVASAL